jgi:hypothetical protein
MLTGIVACGAYVPLRRLGPGTRDWSPTAGRAVANWDQDSLTMAGAARVTIVEVDELVELGGLEPECIVTPSAYVDRVAVRPAPEGA